MHKNLSHDGAPVRTALLLAAGIGSRLSPLTDSTPKCLVEVNRIPILERLMRSLQSNGFKHLLVVTGHLSEVIQDYLGDRYADIEITYVHSPRYKTTNNIYSLWLAGKMIDEPFLLIESDLVFQPERLKPMLQPDRIAVSKMLERAGLSLQDFDFYEIHEAFAAQVLCTLKAWEDSDYCKENLGRDAPLGAVERAKLNVKGSSLAVGHPFAATGARIIGVLAKLLAENGGRGLISICTAGGMGVCAILEAAAGN